jgi:hypothetical protein
MEAKQKKVLLVGVAVIVLFVVILFVLHRFEKRSHELETTHVIQQTRNKPSSILEPFENWGTYKNETIGMELKYPKGLHLKEISPTEIIFDSLEENDSRQNLAMSKLEELTISLRDMPLDEMIRERKSDTSKDYQWSQATLDNVWAEQMSYLDKSLGLKVYTTYIAKGEKTIVIQHGDGNAGLMFRKMIGTVLPDLERVVISFCDRKYEIEAVPINGINIVQKVSELATKNRESRICENVNGDPNKKILPVRLVQSSSDQSDYNPSVYYLGINNSGFKIDTAQNKIYLVGGFDGEPTYIGKY